MLSDNCDSRTGATGDADAKQRTELRGNERQIVTKPRRGEIDLNVVPESQMKGASTDSLSTRMQRGEPWIVVYHRDG
jgi:hypothetical protein